MMLGPVEIRSVFRSARSLTRPLSELPRGRVCTSIVIFVCALVDQLEQMALWQGLLNS